MGCTSSDSVEKLVTAPKTLETTASNPEVVEQQPGTPEVASHEATPEVLSKAGTPEVGEQPEVVNQPGELEAEEENKPTVAEENVAKENVVDDNVIEPIDEEVTVWKQGEKRRARVLEKEKHHVKIKYLGETGFKDEWIVRYCL